VLIGAKLSFAKLFVGQVTVAGLDSAPGFKFWQKVFAATWIRNNHLWESRDELWTVLVIAGAALLVASVLELTYEMAATKQNRGLIALVLGGVVALIGFIGLLTTDGIGANTVFSLVTGAGILVAVVGWGLWRYAPVRRTGAFVIDGRN